MDFVFILSRLLMIAPPKIIQNMKNTSNSSQDRINNLIYIIRSNVSCVIIISTENLNYRDNAIKAGFDPYLSLNGDREAYR